MAGNALKRIADAIWELPMSFKRSMLVPGRIYGKEWIIENLDQGVLPQLANVASLPGIVGHAHCMPDAHWGYGFPIGGVAAMDLRDGVISPGGIGFDINCGMRLVATNLTYEEVKPNLRRLVDDLFANIPSGVGCKSVLEMSKNKFPYVVEQGAKWCIKKGFGWEQDLELTEDRGCATGADSSKVSEKAIERGYDQIGTLGSGNHYLEIQVIKPEHIFDQAIANKLGLFSNQIVIMYHCGSRGFGHQIATDYLSHFLKVMKPKFGLVAIDNELACAPFLSQEGQDYFSAMKCAINMAYINRQMILHRVRETFEKVLKTSADKLGMRQIYDVCHNTAKIEKHEIDGKLKELLVHRKGATRAFGPQMEGLPEKYRDIGQPIIIGGSMETGSYLLSGVPGGNKTFYSTAHGSGRTMSRQQAKRKFSGEAIMKRMQEKGIIIRAMSIRGLAEEAGAAYKDIDMIVDSVISTGLSKKIVKLTPIGNIKG